AFIGGGAIAIGLVCVTVGLAAEPGASPAADGGPGTIHRSAPAVSASPAGRATNPTDSSGGQGRRSSARATDVRNHPSAGPPGRPHDPSTASGKLRNPGPVAPVPATQHRQGSGKGQSRPATSEPHKRGSAKAGTGAKPKAQPQQKPKPRDHGPTKPAHGQ